MNGKPLRRGAAVRPGDVVETAAGARVAFVVGEDAFLLRENSRLDLQKADGNGSLLGGLRILSGALLAVFGKGPRRLSTATATIGIRGTGVYIEASPEQTYFCTCYGDVEISDVHGKERRRVWSGYHMPTMVYAQMVNDSMMEKADVKNHTDDELIMLEGLVGRTSPVQARR